MIAAVLSLAAVALAGCGAGASSPEAGGPTTVSNCGRDVAIPRPPQRIVALGPSEVTSIVAAGAAAKLVGRDDAGQKSAPYTPAIRDAVATVPQLGTGGEITREQIIAMQPDLVVGSVGETVTPESLEAVGIPLISLRGNCGSNHAPGGGDGTADFDDVTADVEQIGRLAGTTGQATAAVADMRSRVTAARPPAGLQGRTVAAAIVFENGLRVYGRRSMAHTQIEALGARDAFGDVASRVVDGSVEELIKRDPQSILLLSYGEDDARTRETFLRIPGAADLTAIRTGSLFVQPYEYSSQGALSVNGLENLARNLAPATPR